MKKLYLCLAMLILIATLLTKLPVRAENQTDSVKNGTIQITLVPKNTSNHSGENVRNHTTFQTHNTVTTISVNENNKTVLLVTNPDQLGVLSQTGSRKSIAFLEISLILLGLLGIGYQKTSSALHGVTIKKYFIFD